MLETVNKGLEVQGDSRQQGKNFKIPKYVWLEVKGELRRESEKPESTDVHLIY